MSESTTNDNINNNNIDNNKNNEKQQPRITSVKEVASTRWLSLQTLTYVDQEGTERFWDVATRTTKPKPTVADNEKEQKADAVIIVPLLVKQGTDIMDTLLVEQFRPPMGQTTIEFPAGLIDKDERPEDAALRELREETGYVGEKCRVVPQVSRRVCMSPGLTDESVHIVVVEVDLDNPYNHGTPKVDLDEGEFVTVKRVSLQDGLQELLKAGSSMPIEGLYMFALGLELGRKQTK